MTVQESKEALEARSAAVRQAKIHDQQSERLQRAERELLAIQKWLTNLIDRDRPLKNVERLRSWNRDIIELLRAP